jgi:acyl carrier protein
MEKEAIVSKLTVIFRNVFTSSDLILNDALSANDVDNWDSLTHMILINEIEVQFDIKFKLKELNKMKNVGDLIEIIQTKLM